MNINHIHVGIRDLPAAIDWLGRVWQVRPAFRNERMASYRFGSFILILDSSEQDSIATIGFESEDCDQDYRGVIERGAHSLEEPKDRAWGGRAAYIKGPGALTFEIEGPPGS